MEHLNFKEQASITKEHLEIYLKNKMELYKLKMAEKTARFGSFIIFGFFTALIALVFIILLVLALALAIGQALNNLPLGLVIAAGVLVVFFLLLLLVKKSFLDNPLLRNILKELEE